MEENKLIGIITDGDLRRALTTNSNLLEMNSEQIMNLNPKTILPELSLGKALKEMEEGSNQISVLPVYELKNKELLGLIRLHDIYTPSMR